MIPKSITVNDQSKENWHIKLKMWTFTPGRVGGVSTQCLANPHVENESNTELWDAIYIQGNFWYTYQQHCGYDYKTFISLVLKYPWVFLNTWFDNWEVKENMSSVG